MTLSEMLAEIRLELTDTDNTRWTDEQLLRLVKRAVRRANLMLRQHGIVFSKARLEMTVEPGQTTISLPDDFLADEGLFRRGDGTELTKRTVQEWETTSSSGELRDWLILGENILVRNPPLFPETLVLHYFQRADTDSWTTFTMETDATPWQGRLDDVIMDYAAIRARNIDEMSVAMDSQLMQDMENRIVTVFNPLAPLITEGSGFM